MWCWLALAAAHLSPHVARATAACFVRGEWVVGRGLGLLRGPSSGWCVRCSPHSCLRLAPPPGGKVPKTWALGPGRPAPAAGAPGIPSGRVS
eukprot:scaffold1301_cov34-Phaeocystis_antarctica.AAC.2